MAIHRGLFVLIVAGVVSLGSAGAMGQDGGDDSDNQLEVLGRWHTVHSDVLDEARRVVVHTPEGYDDSDDSYVVVYVLDADWQFRHMAALVEHLGDRGVDRMPRAIVVGIGNTVRTRDLTPAQRMPDEEGRPTGGSGAFREFVRGELMPWVDGRYRTSGHDVLIGHSYGGLFVLDTVVEDGELFDGYIAISPSLQWNELAFADRVGSFLTETERLDTRLYMTKGHERGSFAEGFRRLVASMEEDVPAGFRWDWRVMEEESHMSVVHRSVRQGLEFQFASWALRDLYGLYGEGGMARVLEAFGATLDEYGIEREMSEGDVFALARELGLRGRLEEGLAVLEYDEERFPVDAYSYYWFGEQYEAAGDDVNAARCYRMTLGVDPGFVEATRRLEVLGHETGSGEDVDGDA